VRTVVVSAPGKAVISGEYAVLRGASGISAALDHRAVVSISASSDSAMTGVHEVSTPGFAKGCKQFQWDDSASALKWVDNGSGCELPIVDCIWQELKVAGKLPGLRISIDTTAFIDDATGTKYGTGSSAAATVALAAALIDVLRLDQEPLATAIAAHRRLQQGRGSGIDVQTASHGGLLQFDPRADVQATSLKWPESLIAAIVWSGQSVSTASKISLFDQVDDSQRQTSSALSNFFSAASDAANAWSAGDVTTILVSMSRYVQCLKQFSERFKLGVFDAGHLLLADLAEECGVIYKPCGAGGGDIGVVFGVDEKAIAAFLQRASDRGFSQLQSRLGDHIAGVTRDVIDD